MIKNKNETALMLIATLMSILASSAAFATESTRSPEVSVTNNLMNEYEASAAAEIKSFCADRWPSDFVMQKHCIDESVEARGKAQQLDVISTAENMVIFGNCAVKWGDSKGRADWVMMSHCIDEQIDALNYINN